MIPLCHILMITNVTVDFEIDEEINQIHAFATVKCKGRQGRNGSITRSKCYIINYL